MKIISCRIFDCETKTNWISRNILLKFLPCRTLMTCTFIKRWVLQIVMCHCYIFPALTPCTAQFPIQIIINTHFPGHTYNALFLEIRFAYYFCSVIFLTKSLPWSIFCFKYSKLMKIKINVWQFCIITIRTPIIWL